jgi:glycosyltransferase involved in cell wall biosynthesis
MRGFRPDIVHTHAAKAGTLGRLAALLSRSRPVTVHTFHGHVLEGYFSKRQASLFRAIERWLAKRTSRLIAVSEEVRDDLVRLGIAPHERISVVPLGFELDRFLLREPERGRRRVAFRAQVGIAESTALVTLVARLVPIKRVDRFLRIARLLSQQSEAEFLIVGDGELRDQLLSDADARALGPRLRWHGFTERIEDVYFASDVVVLTSDNEGTPVSLIEAGAAALPVVSTDVGGVRTVVGDGVSGFVVAREDDRGFAGAVAQLLASPALARAFGAAGRAHVTSTFTLERLVADLDHVYRGLLLRSAA